MPRLLFYPLTIILIVCLSPHAYAADPPKSTAGGEAPELVGEAPALEELGRKLPKIAASNSAVLITGETGTGKDVYARQIHAASPRSKGPFVAINMGGLPEALAEGLLFGYKKGAFTGATKDTIGLLESGNHGTIFLDELGEMPKALQVKLLRALESGKIRRLGENEERDIDIRLISATNAKLEEAVEQGHFRKDLYYRINVFHLELPPLRDRGEDLFLLIDHALTNLEKKGKIHDFKVFSPEALVVMKKYPWPGNVRELKNVVEHAAVISEGPMIKVGDLPDRIANYVPRTPIIPVDATAAEEGNPLSFAADGKPLTLEQRVDIECRKVFERWGNLRRAAEELGIGSRQLEKRLLRTAPK